MFDILILLAHKDFSKFKYVYDSLINIPGYNKVYCISSENVPEKISGVNYFTDKDVIDFDFSKFTGNVQLNSGWYVQQFIKLFQQVTLDNYLVLDSDTIINKKINIIENGKPSFILGRDSLHKPYFDLMKRLFDLERVYNHSFISEIMFFKRKFINKMLSFYGIDKYGFFNMVSDEINRVNKIVGFSEYEFYGNFVTKYLPEVYNYKYIKATMRGKSSVWTDSDILIFIKLHEDCDIISFHTWLDIRD